MADYIVPPRKKKERVLVRCWSCKTLYAPDPNRHPGGNKNYYEFCPVCGTGINSRDNEIPLWKYNLIRYWRGLFNRDKPDAGGADD